MGFRPACVAEYISKSSKVLNDELEGNEAINTVKNVLPKKKSDEVSLSERYTLSIEQASKYFNIGQTRLRSLIHANPNADYLIMVGNRCQIKRKKFEEFIDTATVI